MKNKTIPFRPLSPRHLAVHLLNCVDQQGGYAEPLLDTQLATHLRNDIKSRRLVTQIVFGTLRMRGYLDWIIGQFYRGVFDAMEDGLKNILRTALYQLFFLDRVPSYAVVNEAVNLAESDFRGRGGLVNAILRNALRGKDNMPLPDRNRDLPLYLAVVYSHPRWLVEKWLVLFGEEETIHLCSANNETPPVTIRVNTLKASREEILSAMRDLEMEATPTPYSPDGIRINRSALPVRNTRWFEEGEIQLQDEGSQLISRLLDPQPGETVLDLCAGTGGKTTHLAALMGNTGRIIALDNQEKKLKLLREMGIRMGTTCIEPLCRDGRKPPAADFLKAFDRILVDAPCTGLGTLRRNPEIKWRLAPGDIASTVIRQSDLLEGAARYLKKGGRLVYSTCSLLPEENEDNVRVFLSRHKGFRQETPVGTIPAACIDANGFIKTLPHRHNTDGFFAALLVKCD